MKLSDFSLLKEDDNSYTVGHPKGKSINVPKKGLSDKAQKLITGLKREQHFDDGGEAQADQTPQNADPLQVEPIAPQATQQSSPLSVEETSPQVSAADESQANPAAQAPAPQDPSNANPLTVGLSDQPYTEAEKSIQEGAKAQGDAGIAQAKALGDAVQNAVVKQQHLDSIQQTFDGQNKAFIQKLSNNNIDPNHYWNSLGTGGKISSAIGLVLSGIGSGLTHGPNLAMEVVNNAIARDIESQKNSQDKTMNLWKMNREALGDDRAADLTSISQGYSIAQAKAQQAIAQAQGPEAKARGAQFLLQIQQAQQGINRQRAFLQMANSPSSSSGPGGLSDLDPSQIVNSVADEKQRPEALKEIGQLQQAVKLKQDFLQSYNHIKNLTANGALSPNDVESAKEFLAGPLAKLSEGRFNRDEAKIQVGALLPGKTDSDETVQNKLPRIHQFFDSLVQAPTLRGNHIDPDRFKSTSLKGASNSYMPGSVVEINGRRGQVQADGRTVRPI